TSPQYTSDIKSQLIICTKGDANIEINCIAFPEEPILENCLN
ncbi:unnamed protein product, partial [marine sediment metagenome]